jgi:two-component system chemotaxis sensor kinase CheA
VNEQRLERFRALFAQEAEVRLARIRQLMLSMDQEPAPDVIDQLFREVHTLKGSAAVVELDELSNHAHLLEERLAGLRGTPELDAAVVDELLAAADTLAELTATSLAGSPTSSAPAAPTAPHASPPPPEIPVGTAAPPEHRAPAASGDERRLNRGTSRGAIMVPVERLEELVRLVGEAASAELRIERLVSERLGPSSGPSAELRDLSRLLNDIQDRAMRTQMVPVSTVTDQLQRAVRDLARSLGKEVRWEVEGEQTELERNMVQQLADALVHIVRNAVDHGIEPPDQRAAAGKPRHGTVRLHARQRGSEVIISVSDDGRGIDVDAVRRAANARGIDTDELSEAELLQLVFRAGLSTAARLTDVSGRGVGLDAVQASIEASRGRVAVQSALGTGSTVHLAVPITLAVLACLLVEAGGQRFAVPLHRVVVARSEDAPVVLGEGRHFLWLGDEPVPVTPLAAALGRHEDQSGGGPAIVVRGTLQRHAFQVDRIVGHRDVVVKAVSSVLPHIDVVAGTSIEPDGSVLVVLDPPRLVERVRHTAAFRPSRNERATDPPARHRLLVVDDALTVRELQRSILERAGFEVLVAGDGLDALAQLDHADVELVLTDVEMPRMNGFELTRAIRARPGTQNLPVVIVTTLASEAHRREGMEAGADGYIVKANFDERALLEVVERMIGRTA